jgi:hypothetical protein
MKDKKLNLYQEYHVKIANKFEKVKFTHLSRDKNWFADAFVILASITQINCDKELQPLCIKIKNDPAYCC